MLIPIERITRRGASETAEITVVGINPATLDKVEPWSEHDVEGPCILITTMHDTRIIARGTVESIIAATQGELQWQEQDDTGTD